MMNEQPYQTYLPFRASDIVPERHTAHDMVQYSRAESDATSRGRDVWVHGSISGKGEPCRVIQSRHTGLLWCSNPNHLAYGQKTPCRHLQNLLWWLTYEWAYRDYEALELSSLRSYERTYAQMALGLLVPTRGWDAVGAALGDVIAARLAARRVA
jgi:hypothetical protein